ncbi:uncharacterized protein BO96DRAFT_402260 [Aspergillus niger CBS 101883]|uniref:uncharacterized protein n=1 Tax=Aspergillus lacticoffeatus (strain CBS 101883) TaxID=1450533 RepID=UPI000D800A42|nr:uncharacterized protein BO96DRAFT_402260 [Aspergillus niger CBS 101883]PYH52148.1 hypothetical protein BO96DRAFT_402260 [Aspergillus niger CBS 101883]
MSRLERSFNTQSRVLQKSKIKYLCPKCFQGFSRSDVLYQHFRQKADAIHKGLDSNKSNFALFLSSYRGCMGSLIPAAKLPKAPDCFDVFFVIEHYGEETESPNISDYAQSYTSTPSMHSHSCNFSVPLYHDRQPRGYDHDSHRDTALSTMPVPEQHIRHLQILHDVQVEAKICALLPQMDNWLDGTLPLSDQPRHDFGIIVPSVDVDRPLIPVRDLLYKGFGTFALIRTSKDVFSPQNIPEAVYTVLRVDGPGLIGNQKVAIGESIWVSHQTTLSAGLILLIGVFPTVVVGQKV